MDPRICSNRFGVKGVRALVADAAADDRQVGVGVDEAGHAHVPVDIDEPCMAVSEATQVR
jgi:hypothetical protein